MISTHFSRRMHFQGSEISLGATNRNCLSTFCNQLQDDPNRTGYSTTRLIVSSVWCSQGMEDNMSTSTGLASNEVGCRCILL